MASLKILAAEDEPDILRLYKMLLEYEGHEVYTAKDGQECMDMYNKMLGSSFDVSYAAPFDLLILDYRMPKKTGVEVANEVLHICPRQQILMVTAYAGQLELTQNLQKIKILRKPFEIDELISMVSNFFAKPMVR